MMLFRVLLAVMIVVLGVYTAITISNEGFSLFDTAQGDVAAMGWRGQFALDFVCYLLLSFLWIAWRHEFSLAGIVFGLLASQLGILFFASYLIVISIQSNGDMSEILMGRRLNKAGVLK